MTPFRRNSFVAIILSLTTPWGAHAAEVRGAPPTDSYEITLRICQHPSSVELCQETLKSLRIYRSAALAANERLSIEEVALQKQLDERHAAIDRMTPGRERVQARREALRAFEDARTAGFDKMTAALAVLSSAVAGRLNHHPEVSGHPTLMRFGFLRSAILRGEQTRLLLQEPGVLQIYLKLPGANVDYIKDCRLKNEDSFNELDLYQSEPGDGSLLVQVVEEAGGIALKINVDAGIHRRIDNCGPEPGAPAAQ